MIKKLVLLFAVIAIGFVTKAQQIGSSPGYVKALTADWKGERFPDGRPKVPDIVLERLQEATLEQIWGFLGKNILPFLLK